MSPEGNNKPHEFVDSEEAGEFLIEIAHRAAKFVNGKKKYRGGYPTSYPHTWFTMIGAEMTGEAVKKLTREDMLGLMPELTILHLYLEKLTKNCRNDVGFLENNLRWAQEITHNGLNQPHGRIMMYAGILETKRVLADKLVSATPCSFDKIPEVLASSVT